MAAYKVRTRHHYVDAQGNKLPAIPTSNQISFSDVAAAKGTWDDIDNEVSMTVAAPVGVEGATHIRFEEFKATAAGAGATRVQLVLGKLETELVLATDVAANAAITATDRLQGLDSMLFGIGQRIAFKQLV